jgi:hypothetical protein
METSFIEAFQRGQDGSWTCVAPATFEGPNGRIQVAPGTRFTAGTAFMGVDLAKWLDEQERRLQKTNGV